MNTQKDFPQNGERKGGTLHQKADNCMIGDTASTGGRGVDVQQTDVGKSYDSSFLTIFSRFAFLRDFEESISFGR
jgi:hypothetical protein